MSIGKKCSFWNLYRDHGIRIPQIQRDYVQGRENARIKVNRKSFVADLVESLVNNRPISLNFIYGYYEEDNQFIPIDGQQRLTTLFLLHFYVFSKCNNRERLLDNDALRFSYETRYTTDRFLNELFHNDWSKNPQDASWFSYSWNTDPSVCSCLTMLNEIEGKFSEYSSNDWEEYENRLVAGNCPISFMLLELDRDQLGKPNQLYIRMNSRGKQLTDFENFKVSLYEYIDSIGDGQLFNLKSQLTSNIDVAWQELIWGIPCDNTAVGEKYSDTFYRDLLHWIFINTACVNDIFAGESKFDWIRPDKKDINTIFLENYVEELLPDHEEYFINYIWDIFTTFSVLNYLKELNRDDLLRQIINYSETKGRYSTELPQYKSRTLLYATTVFGRNYISNYQFDSDAFNLDDFKAWYRIVLNLVNNTEIDNPKAFIDACKAIDAYHKATDASSVPLDKWLSCDADTGFANRQIKEERFKLNIMKDEGWKNAVIQAEENDYFNGEILFSFYFIGVKKAEDANADNLARFSYLWEIINKVIVFAKDNDVLFHRALLTYGDYSVRAPGNNENISTYYKYSEKHHNYDWRGMLRPNTDTDKQPTGANNFKQFIYACKDCTPTEAANKAILEFEKKDNAHKSMVQLLLIKVDGMFNYCKNYYYIWYDKIDDTSYDGPWDRYCLMKTSRRNCYMEARAYYEYLFAIKSGHQGSIREGGNPWDEEKRRSYVTINDNDQKEYKTADAFLDGFPTTV